MMPPTMAAVLSESEGERAGERTGEGMKDHWLYSLQIQARMLVYIQVITWNTLYVHTCTGKLLVSY